MVTTTGSAWVPVPVMAVTRLSVGVSVAAITRVSVGISVSTVAWIAVRIPFRTRVPIGIPIGTVVWVIVVPVTIIVRVSISVFVTSILVPVSVGVRVSIRVIVWIFVAIGILTWVPIVVCTVTRVPDIIRTVARYPIPIVGSVTYTWPVTGISVWTTGKVVVAVAGSTARRCVLVVTVGESVMVWVAAAWVTVIGVSVLIITSSGPGWPVTGMSISTVKVRIVDFGDESRVVTMRRSSAWTPRSRVVGARSSIPNSGAWCALIRIAGPLTPIFVLRSGGRSTALG